MDIKNGKITLTKESKVELQKKGMYVSETQIMYGGYVHDEVIKESTLKHVDNRFDSWDEYYFNGKHRCNIICIRRQFYIFNLATNKPVNGTGTFKNVEAAKLFIDTFL